MSTTERLLRRRAALAEGDADRERLRQDAIRAGLPVARRLAGRYRGRGEPLEDLRQVAALALVTAVDGYEPARGPFENYAVVTILGALKRHFRDHGWAVHVPRRQQELVRAIRAAVGPLTQCLVRTPSAADLADHLGVSEVEFRQALVAARCYESNPLDVPAGEGLRPVSETVGRDEEGYAEVIDRLSVQALVRTLPPRQQQILRMSYFANMPQAQIGAELGLSQTYVGRLLAQALTRLGGHLAA